MVDCAWAKRMHFDDKLAATMDEINFVGGGNNSYN